MNLNHIYYNVDENIYNVILTKTTLQSAVNFGIISPQSQKTTASREKLNILHMANDSTPTNDRAFFVRNNRTPKENAVFILHTKKPIFLSMVERNGQPFAVGCLPYVAVSHPVTFYRPTVRSLAVVPKNQHMELLAMYQFIFAPTRAPRIKIRILADNEQQARARFTNGESLLFVGRINLDRIQHSPLAEVKDGTNWHHVNIHTLPKSQDVGIIQSTTTIDGARNRDQCAIFLPQIPFNGSAPLAHTYHQAEFVARSIRRNKAHTRTNKASRSIAVVEALSHLTTGYGNPFTKQLRNPTMKIYSQNHRTFADNPALSVSAVMGVNHA